MPELHVLAGPNGSGKSSFTRQVRDGSRKIDYSIPPVINPDVIAQQLNASDPDAAELAAGREAVRARNTAIANRESFAFETTLSGHSELRVIRKAQSTGYSLTMSYIAVESAELSLARVIVRAHEEKRTVARELILRRYPKSLENFSAIVSDFDRVDVYDNSATDLRSVARLERGRIISIGDDMPTWATKALSTPLAVAHDRATVTREAYAYFQGKQRSSSQTIFEEDTSHRARLSGPVLVKGGQHIAIGTSPWSFAIVELRSLTREVQPGEHVRVERKDGTLHVCEPDDRKADRSRKRGR